MLVAQHGGGRASVVAVRHVRVRLARQQRAKPAYCVGIFDQPDAVPVAFFIRRLEGRAGGSGVLVECALNCSALIVDGEVDGTEVGAGRLRELCPPARLRLTDSLVSDDRPTRNVRRPDLVGARHSAQTDLPLSWLRSPRDVVDPEDVADL